MDGTNDANRTLMTSIMLNKGAHGFQWKLIMSNKTTINKKITMEQTTLINI